MQASMLGCMRYIEPACSLLTACPRADAPSGSPASLSLSSRMRRPGGGGWGLVPG